MPGSFSNRGSGDGLSWNRAVFYLGGSNAAISSSDPSCERRSRALENRVAMAGGFAWRSDDALTASRIIW